MNQQVNQAVMAKTAQYHAACRYVLRCKLANYLQAKYGMNKQAEPLSPETAYRLGDAGIGAIGGGLGGASLGALIQALRGKDIMSGIGSGGLAGAIGGGLGGYFGGVDSLRDSIGGTLSDAYDGWTTPKVAAATPTDTASTTGSVPAAR